MCCNTCEPAEEDHKPVREIRKERGCTDLLFLFLFVAFWGFTFYLVYLAEKNDGNPQRIVRGVDMEGNICGISPLTLHRPYAAWAHPTVYSAKVCVADCNETQIDTAHFAVRRKTTKFVYYCLPIVLPISINVSAVSGEFNSPSEKLSRYIGDLFLAWPMILASSGIALIVAFLYTWLLKGCAHYFIWGLLILSILLGFALTYLLITRGLAITDTDDVSIYQAKAYKIAGGCVGGVTFVFACIILYLRSRINLAIAVVQDAGNVLRDMTGLVLFPIFPIIVAVGYSAFWIYVFMTLYSVGDWGRQYTPPLALYDAITFARNENPDTMVVRRWNTKTRNYVIAHLFGLAWNLQFLIYFTYMVISGAVANWYFSSTDQLGHKTRGNGKEMLPHSPIWASVKRVIRYHLGSLALGSLIMAMITTIRAVLLYIQRKTASKSNCCVRCMLACVQCCLRCMQTFIDKLSKNSFVWTSVFGHSFCQAGCSSFQLLWKNLGHVAAINMVSSLLLVFGKFLIVLITVGLCAAAMIGLDPFGEEFSSPLLPLIFIGIISYLVASLFMVTFETTIDTMFLCFLIDTEHNGADLMAPQKMRELVAKHSDESKKVAAERHALRRAVAADTPPMADLRAGSGTSGGSGDVYNHGGGGGGGGGGEVSFTPSFVPLKA